MKKILLGLLPVLVFTGCESVNVTQIASSASNIFTSFQKSQQGFDTEQEYYLGRTVSANILNEYPLYNNKEATSYLNQVGKTLSLNSDMPETYGGYHFAILDSDEINAFAAPGGFIFVTKGMVKLCKSEDALASVLAHEIAHVELKHGVDSIKQSRMTELATVIGKESIKNFGDEKLQAITENFGGAIEDIMHTMVVNGYSRELEFEADQNAIKILKRTGYNTSAIVDMLSQMDKRLEHDTLGFGSTHPAAKDRIESLKELVDNNTNIPQNRQKRFNKFINSIKS